MLIKIDITIHTPKNFTDLNQEIWLQLFSKPIKDYNSKCYFVNISEMLKNKSFNKKQIIDSLKLLSCLRIEHNLQTYCRKTQALLDSKWSICYIFEYIRLTAEIIEYSYSQQLQKLIQTNPEVLDRISSSMTKIYENKTTMLNRINSVK